MDQKVVSDTESYRQMLERIAADQSALEMAKSIADDMDWRKKEQREIAQQLIQNALDKYEESKRFIAEKLLEKLG